MTELQSRLQAAVGGTYSIEGELGGGGMSRVFVAEEVKFGRKVVIKVLPPEMGAGVNTERFEREIQLAAKLQHPHVVPLLTAGSQDDLLWYVMPLIVGESLRSKLAREHELPIGEVARVLRDVSDALAYAHRNGVVHRDIKPDNVLLSDGHALVTDFGVAKAVSDSTGEQSLTSMGVALGTPAYMSPEQAVANPQVDHRADIYALGALAYEMLCGRPPFDGHNAQAILSAHVTKAPDPPSDRRSTIPPALNELVLRCLAKLPADRWQNADELKAQFENMATPASGGVTPTGTQPVVAVGAELALRQNHPLRVVGMFGVSAVAIMGVMYFLMIQWGLPDWVLPAAVGLLVAGAPVVWFTGHRQRQRAVAHTTGIATVTPTGLQRHFTWRKSILGGTLAFMGLGAVTAAYMGMRFLGVGPAATLMSAGTLDERRRLVLAEFENRTADTSLGSTVTTLFRISLEQSPVINLLDDGQISMVLERMERQTEMNLTPSLAREIAEREGIGAVITGEILTIGRGFALSARVVETESGEVIVSRQESAADAEELFGAVDRLSAKLRERIGESLRTVRRQDPLFRVTTGSLDALRLYTQALGAENAGDDDRAVDLLEQAVAIDTTFAMAYRKIGTILGNRFERRSRMVETTTRAYEYRTRLPERERFHAEGMYHIRVTGEAEQAVNAYLNLLERYPDDNAAINNLGVLYGRLRNMPKAEEYYAQALSQDSGVAMYYANLAGTQAYQGKRDAAAATLDALAERYPRHPQVTQGRARIAIDGGDYQGGEHLLDSLRVAQGGSLSWREELTRQLSDVAAVQGKLDEARRYWQEALAATRQRELGAEYVREVTVVALVQLLVEDDPDSALSTVSSALDRYPLEEMIESDRPYDALVVVWALAGRLDEARRLMDEYSATGLLETNRDDELWSHWATGAIALAAGRADEAVTEFRPWADKDECMTCGLPWLARAYDASGAVDSAIAVFRQYADSPRKPMFMMSHQLPHAYRRLGELYDARGDEANAVEYYNRFVDLWQNADAELQPQVSDVRQRIARLVGER